MRKFVEIMIGFVVIIATLFAFIAAIQADRSTVYTYPYTVDAAVSARNISIYNIPTVPTPADMLSTRLDAANASLSITP